MPAITLASGLIIEDLVTGNGAEAAAGQEVTVHYTGWLTDGKKFDSRRTATTPSCFRWVAAACSAAGTRACKA